MIGREERRGPAGLLAVFAHPDDESLACGGLLAWCASLGMRVTLLCVTRGEHGSVPADAPDVSLPDLRARELEAAARVLGVAEVTLLEYEDGFLPWADAASLEGDITRAIRDAAPEAVITFDEDGLYWHPDHVVLHERTTSAVASLGSEAPALYYVTIPPGRMRALQTAAAAREPHRRGPLHILGITDADAFGAMAQPPSLVFDVTAFAPRKLAAVQCHASQTAGGTFEVLREEDAVALLGLEQLRRAPIGSPDDTWLDHVGKRLSQATR